MTPKEKQLDVLFQKMSNGKKCAHCRQPAICSHHLVRRGDSRMLRWNPINAMFLCLKCHNEIHKRGALDVINELPEYQRDYLKRYRYLAFKDYLLQRGYDNESFLDECKRRMEAEII